QLADVVRDPRRDPDARTVVAVRSRAGGRAARGEHQSTTGRAEGRPAVVAGAARAARAALALHLLDSRRARVRLLQLAVVASPAAVGHGARVCALLRADVSRDRLARSLRRFLAHAAARCGAFCGIQLTRLSRRSTQSPRSPQSHFSKTWGSPAQPPAKASPVTTIKAGFLRLPSCLRALRGLRRGPEFSERSVSRRSQNAIR